MVVVVGVVVVVVVVGFFFFYFFFIIPLGGVFMGRFVSGVEYFLFLFLL